MDEWNVFILILQSIILLGQLCLSKKINDQSISKEKGYFIIEETNFCVPKEHEGMFRDQFKISRGIGFYVTGNSDVILKSMEFNINNVPRQNAIPSNTYFTLGSRFHKLVVDLNLKESDLSKEKMDVDILMKLENPVGFKYIEKINIQFQKHGSDDDWIICKYNMSFK